ncbi:hypothetical protein GIS00_09875 [Nakamurella sp. YIM 132087]|uniref:Uncharacterized protein n=1 Tax=Nakamurella alba TaxID=2665158 RepID=A0A7K1FN95_9ACTN|nr:hypothetical protein [Nakamurella alba]MTD14254.1 hypothetical protein [Nakamurella alba]
MAGPALSTGPVPAAAPEPACVAHALLPTRIPVDRQERIVSVRLSGCEGYLRYAGASVTGPSDIIDYLEWDNVRTTQLHVYDTIVPGSYRTVDGWGMTKDGDVILFESTSTVIKFATFAGVAVSRSGGIDRVTVAAKRYAALDGFIAYPNRVVGIQSAPSATGPWTNAGFVKVGATGRATLGVRADPGRFYRSYFGETGSFFSAQSVAAGSPVPVATDPTVRP